MIIALDGFQFHHISWHIHMNHTRIKNKIKLNVAQFTNAGADEKLLTLCGQNSRAGCKAAKMTKSRRISNTGNKLWPCKPSLLIKSAEFVEGSDLIQKL